MSLEQDAFVTLYDGLNEHTKKPVLSKILSRLSLDEILGDPTVLNKLKKELIPRVSEILKDLLTKTTNPWPIVNCFKNPRYIIQLHRKTERWRFLMTTEDGRQIAVNNVYQLSVDKFSVKDIQPFDINKVLSDKLYIIYTNHGLHPWYVVHDML